MLLPGKFEITHVMEASTPPLKLYFGWSKLLFLVVLAITAIFHLSFGCHFPNPITQSNPYVVLKLNPESSTSNPDPKEMKITPCRKRNVPNCTDKQWCRKAVWTWPRHPCSSGCQMFICVWRATGLARVWLGSWWCSGTLPALHVD